MRALTEPEVAALFRRMRAYRALFWVYAASAVLYLFAALGLPASPIGPSFPVADAALVYGALCALAVFAGKWAAFRPSALKARSLTDLTAASTYIFLTLAFLLAAGESIGMAAVVAATLGGGPPWKLVMPCLWQLAAAVVLTPDRAHWDRLLTRWESSFDGGRDEAC